MKWVMLFIIPVFLLSGCDTCEPAVEPLIVIRNLTSNQYQNVFGVGRPGELIKEKADQQWALPVSLADDYSSFVFEGQNIRDTITFLYKREAKLESNKCGIRVFLRNMRLGEPNTFSEVEVKPSGISSYGAKKFYADIKN